MELIRTPKVENVRMLYRYPNATAGSSTSGTLYLTATHLIFVDHNVKRENWILHTLIASIEKLSITTNGSPLLMRCKHFLCVTFIIPKERDAHDIYLSIYQLSQPTHIEELYCFHYTASNEHFDKEDGWNKYSFESEFERMGCPNQYWIQATINHNYEVCDTYPRSLYVPSTSTKQILLGSANFRSKGRLPVLTYLHKNNAAICRCSQPLSGFSARCVEDEQLLTCILKANPNSKVLYVVDTRPRINAMVNKAQGKGYENEIYYENIKFHFFGIENIHVMRGSLQKLMDACELKVPSMNAFLTGVEGSGWLRHVKSVLETSAFIAKSVVDGITVIVHCSDGWDRTAQTCGIAAILLDPYYRTIDGFQALIEKEWLSFGHKFNDRCGHIQGDSKEMAPVFTQFLDAIWQLTQQFPQHFQFNEKYLLTLHDHVHSCQFGTFIANCDKERRDLRVIQRTYSLWAYFSAHRLEFINPLYDRQTTHEVIDVNVSPQLIRFWRGLYNRFETGVHPRHCLTEILLTTHNHISSLENHIRYLEQKISHIERNSKKSSQLDTPSKSDSLTSAANGSSSLTESENRIGSLDLDELDSPLKVVEECMNRLERSKLMDSSVDGEVFVSSAQMKAELETVALDWQSLNAIKECNCSTPFEPFGTKINCHCCGQLYCVRCIDKRIALPGHAAKEPVPVCRHCYRNVMRSNSIDCI